MKLDNLIHFECLIINYYFHLNYPKNPYLLGNIINYQSITNQRFKSILRKSGKEAAD